MYERAECVEEVCLDMQRFNACALMPQRARMKLSDMHCCLLVTSGLRIGIFRRSVVKREAAVLTKQNNVSVRSANSFQHHQPASLTNSANLAGLIFTFQAFVSNIFA
jgi:hypothetical protein